ncbi:hypothetical protein NPIL_636011 [Nephila pilipes]|uniref:Uncharacterized protein n=1 Tax=Nephila pilipes TaxID=299642 RepID=A0A8X6PAN1_NEPPI|nr:hypothetical protein NPIL_636011 [Nephila pilipes]
MWGQGRGCAASRMRLTSVKDVEDMDIPSPPDQIDPGADGFLMGFAYFLETPSPDNIVPGRIHTGRGPGNDHNRVNMRRKARSSLRIFL